MQPAIQTLKGQERHCTWTGEVTWREVPELRESLFDQLEVPGSTGVRLDVRAVTVIDHPGIAVLLGANYRATATGRRLILLDAGGPVTVALARKHLTHEFLLTQLFTANRAPQATEVHRGGGDRIWVRPLRCL